MRLMRCKWYRFARCIAFHHSVVFTFGKCMLHPFALWFIKCIAIGTLSRTRSLPSWSSRTQFRWPWTFQSASIGLACQSNMPRKIDAFFIWIRLILNSILFWLLLILSTGRRLWMLCLYHTLMWTSVSFITIEIHKFTIETTLVVKWSISLMRCSVLVSKKRKKQDSPTVTNHNS